MCQIADPTVPAPEFDRYGYATAYRVVTRDNRSALRLSQVYLPGTTVAAAAGLVYLNPKQSIAPTLYYPGDPVPAGAKVTFGIHTVPTVAAARRLLDVLYGWGYFTDGMKIIRVQCHKTELISGGWQEQTDIPCHVWGEVYVPHDCDVPEAEPETEQEEKS